MKQFVTVLFTGALLCLTSLAFSQERYLDEVFAEVTVTDSVIYGANHSVFLAALGVGDTMVIPQFMDIYEPTGDTVSERPVILFGITGTFFPAYINGGFTGERSDLANVEIATRLAKMGYVVAVVQYRRGWNSRGDATTQQKTILHAAYRGIQDMRMAVRFFRKTAAEDGNNWRIDVDKVAVGGQGTGGYMAYGASYLDNAEQTFITKFLEEVSPGVFQPFVDTTIFGGPLGTDTALLNLPNHPTYSSDFNVGFALGGALGDSSWVNEGDIPFIALHCYRDELAPFGVGDVLANDPTTNPPTPFAVIPSGSGGQGTVGQSHNLGNQSVFETFPFPLTDPVSVRAGQIDGGISGLYPFITPFTGGDAECLGVGVPGDTLREWGDPWNWYPDSAVVVGTWNAVWAAAIGAGLQIDGETSYCRNKRSSPYTEASAKLYIDTIISFLAPRLAITMALPNTLGVNDIIDQSNVNVYPNPSNDRMSINYVGTDAKPIKEVKIMDLSGRIVRTFTNVNATQFEISKGNLSPGLYLLQIKVGEKFANKKIVFN